MIKIALIGSGNVAQHLISAFNESTETQIVQVFSRSPFTFDNISVVHDLNELAEADLYIIAVSDDAISDISEQLPFQNRLVVHTSGSVPIEVLSSKNRKGVFYPLQTFTKNKKVDFKSIPICLESESKSDMDLLQKVAGSISDQTFEISSEQRKSLHVSAVFVNNFVNHLYKIGNDICSENEVPFDILKPLIRETADKILTLSPNEAQTGPAKRNDSQTIQRHLDFLSDDNQKNIYKLLTQSIQNGKDL